jgi:hypothetical protein
VRFVAVGWGGNSNSCAQDCEECGCSEMHDE